MRHRRACWPLGADGLRDPFRETPRALSEVLLARAPDARTPSRRGRTARRVSAACDDVPSFQTPGRDIRQTIACARCWTDSPSSVLDRLQMILVKQCIRPNGAAKVHPDAVALLTR